MHSHPPYPCQRTSSDFEQESRGVFRVLHDKGLGLDCTHDRPELRAMNLQSERPLRWLWQDKIPLGKLTLIEGPPAVGKLFVALDIAARVSTGALCGDDVYPPREVPSPEVPTQSDDEPLAVADLARAPRGGDGLNSGESPADNGHPVVLICDSWQAEDMIAPRLRMLGANQQRIVSFTEVNCTDSCGGHKHSRPIRFPLDRPMFEYILRQNRGCRLIVIDNLENYCDSPRQLRQAIKDLDETAIYFGVAIVATLQGNVRFTPDGTIRDTARTIDGPARCIWCLTPDAAHPGLLRLEPKRMAFCKKPEGIACRISDAGQVVWEPLPPYEKPPTEAARRKKLEHVRMLTWLGATLGIEIVRAETIYDAGREQGFSKNKLIEARDELGARTFKFGFGRKGGWMWTLKPESEVTDAEVQFAYVGLPLDFFEQQDEIGMPLPGEEDAGDAGRGEEDTESSATRAAQKTTNSGVLNENGWKSAGSGSSPTARKRSNSYAGMNTAQLRKLAMQMLGLTPEARQDSPEREGQHVGNGRSSNRHSGNGHRQNGK